MIPVLFIPHLSSLITLARVARFPASVQERVDALFEFAMSRCIALGKLLHVPEIESRVREGKPGKSVVEFAEQTVTIVVAREYLNSQAAKRFQIAIKTPDIEFEPSEQ